MYEYRAKVASVHDGDTLRLDIDCGFNVWLHRVPCRLLGVDAPELGTPEGRAARDWLRAWLPVGANIIVRTHLDEADKYGRWLADISQGPADITTVNQRLIDAGHARPYDGGKR